MTQPAKVSSIDALRDFRRAVERFGVEIAGALSEVDSTAQRTLSWLSHDQLPHWQRQIRARSEKLAQARSNLLRKQLSSMQDDPTCIDERRAVERAKQAIEDANEKVRLVKKWLIMVDKEYTLYRGATSGLADTHQRDIPAAAIRLAAMVNRLEEYAAIGAQPPSGSAAGNSSESGDAGEIVLNDLEPVEAESGQQAESQTEHLSKLRRLCPSESARGAAPRDDSLVRAWSIATESKDPSRRSRIDSPDADDATAEPDGALDQALTSAALTPYLGEPPRADERVTLAPGVLDGRDFFLARLVPAFPGDSGWFLGGIEWVAHADPGVGIVSVSIGWLCEKRPALGELLRLPRGFLVTLLSGSLGAVLDEQDARIVGELGTDDDGHTRGVAS